MGKEIPLGRIAGVKVSMDFTVPFIAVFGAALYATSGRQGFPAIIPGLSTTAYWVAAAVLALLFFVSLLIHEMGHALVAQDEGIGVRGISLWLLGGVAKLESSPTNPRTEFRIAVVGPLASLGTGVAFLVASYVIPDGDGLIALAGAGAFVLGTINVLLAVFNMLPAAPLDGGTVLSALIWKQTGSQATGMRWSAYSGLATGSALILYGIRGGTDNALILILVGGFIALAAYRMLRSLPMYELLDGVTVADAMAPAPPPAPGWSRLDDFVSTLPVGNQYQAYPVFDQHSRVQGLLTVAAIRAVPEAQWAHVHVAHIAFPIERITIVRPQEPLLPAVQRVDGGDVRDGLVVDPGGAIVGTISAAALFATLERRKLQAASQ